ncbi:MAG: peptidylprolyl isomerase [Candidatus Latescibacterota bacterium]
MEIVYTQGSLTAENVLKFMFLSGGADSVMRDCIVRQEALREGKKLGIVISDEMLQSVADEYRIVRGLHYSQDMVNYLKGKGLSVEEFERFCEESVMLTLLRERLADGESIKKYFLNHRSRFDRARLSIITVEEENLAQELFMRMSEDGEDFHALARQYSIDEYRNAGGYLGLVRRGSLSPDMDAKIFNAPAGDILGPFPDSERFHLFLVEEIVKAELNEKVAEEIKVLIFNEWAARFQQTGVRV